MILQFRKGDTIRSNAGLPFSQGQILSGFDVLGPGFYRIKWETQSDIKQKGSSSHHSGVEIEAFYHKVDLHKENAELNYMTERHHQEVVCTKCKEWTSFGDSCCGKTFCEEGCPVCKKSA